MGNDRFGDCLMSEYGLGPLEDLTMTWCGGIGSLMILSRYGDGVLMVLFGDNHIYSPCL